MSLVVAYFGILSVLIIALNARFFGELLGVMDDPSRENHKSHTLPTPLIGALMIGVLALFIILNQFVFNTSSRMIGISVCTILVAILGFVDDKVQLSWQSRLIAIGSVTMLLVIWVPELQLNNLTWSFGYMTDLGPVFGPVFTVMCLMTLVVAFNMMDGFNGGVIGMSLILFIVMALVATNPHRQAICLFLASALGVMFIYNMKGEFFLGDGGAYALGLLVGSTALLTYKVGANIPIYADTIFLWLTIPTLDCLRVVISRRLSKANPFYAGRDHLHHILMASIGPTKTLFVFLVTTAGFGAASLFSGSSTFILFILQVVTLAVAIHFARRLRKSAAE